jgi:hypothetical protein
VLLQEALRARGQVVLSLDIAVVGSAPDALSGAPRLLLAGAELLDEHILLTLVRVVTEPGPALGDEDLQERATIGEKDESEIAARVGSGLHDKLHFLVDDELAQEVAGLERKRLQTRKQKSRHQIRQRKARGSIRLKYI